MKVKQLIRELEAYNPDCEVNLLVYYVQGKNGYGISNLSVGYSVDNTPVIILTSKEIS